jgi:hypothetical protein
MPRHTTPTTQQPLNGLLQKLTRAGALGALLALLATSTAHAGTYEIDNCPSAPVPNGNPGPWTVFGSPQNAKGSCNAGPGDYIGPSGASMSPGTFDGVHVTVPSGSGITIREAEIWWAVPHQISGATTFPAVHVEAGGTGAYVSESDSPLGNAAPDHYVLPSTTTTFTLEDYCSADDGAAGCAFGEGENANLELYGAQLTLADSTLPTGNVTGGALASTNTLSGTQTLAYSVADHSSGVRLVKLLVDGNQVATNDYPCPYENFLACQESASDTITWNTATVTDGQHTLEAIVEDAAQNTAILYDATITTNNAPTNTTPPGITTPSQPSVGATLTAQPGIWTAPTGAGPLTYSYQWQDCNPEGNNCQAIPHAQSSTYTPEPSDTGHTLRVLATDADNDGTTTLASPPTSSVRALVLAAGTSGTLPGTGTPNGTPASETATLHLTTPTTLLRSFAHRAFELAGRLTNNQAQPIADATLDVLTQNQDASTPTIIKHTTTSPTGAFTVNIPPGPSRLIEIGYRAYTNDNAYAATATVHEIVPASVAFNIVARHIVAPHTISPTGIIELTGKVGPIPHQGTIVDLLVHYRGAWELIRKARTNSTGYFRAVYQFQGAIGTFPFQAEVPYGQAGFPFTTGYSRHVDVTTG